MTNEKLTQANDLLKEMKELRDHYKDIKTEKEAPYEGDSARILIENNSDSHEKRLIFEFLPIELPQFVELYLSKIDKKIKKLEKEFEKL